MVLFTLHNLKPLSLCFWIQKEIKARRIKWMNHRQQQAWNMVIRVHFYSTRYPKHFKVRSWVFDGIRNTYISHLNFKSPCSMNGQIAVSVFCLTSFCLLLFLRRCKSKTFKWTRNYFHGFLKTWFQSLGTKSTDLTEIWK